MTVKKIKFKGFDLKPCRPRKELNYQYVYEKHYLEFPDYKLFKEILYEYYKQIELELFNGKDLKINSLGIIGLRKHKYRYNLKKKNPLIEKLNFQPVNTEDWIVTPTYYRQSLNNTKYYSITLMQGFKERLYKDCLIVGGHKNILERDSKSKKNRNNNS